MQKYFNLCHFLQNFNECKPLHIRYDNRNGFIKTYNKIRYLVLFDEWCDKICDRIKYLINKKSGITNSINIILEESELIHIIFSLLRKYGLFIMF